MELETEGFGHPGTVRSMDSREPNSGPGESPVRTVSRHELQRLIQEGLPGFRLVMALNDWAFRAKHIPGSEHFNTPDELYSSLRREDEIVVYCTSDDCHASVALYHDLVDRGYEHVRRYAGGLTDWEAAGLPLEGAWVA